MMADADVIVIGSGPAGVSAAFPLVEAGLRVLMVDGGAPPSVAPPPGQYLEQRTQQASQWQWMLGPDFHALRNADAVSPKLRVPGHRHVFDGFAEANKVVADGFIAAGSLASGGLSNAWGCGVARLSPHELAAFPCPASEMDASYETVTRRMGVSGAADDDLSDYFGLDEWADEPVPLDTLHGRLLTRYQAARQRVRSAGVSIGRSRVAVLTKERDGRGACDLTGTCLWGCHRRALYAAGEDLELLARHASFELRPGFVVQRVQPRVDGLCAVYGKDSILRAPRVMVAAGTLASTRLVLDALDSTRAVPFQSSPTAAYLLWVPALLGQPHQRTFGLGQLSFTVDLPAGIRGFGSLFATTGIPVVEFLRHLPLTRRAGADVLSTLLSSCTIGNLFLPGSLSDAQLALQPDGTLRVSGNHRPETAGLLDEAAGQLRRAFRSLGAWMLPGSFTHGRPGGDIHYAASLPMRATPRAGETDALGEPAGLPGLHVVDGASLPMLPEKSHTLTLMANADRIGRRVAAALGRDR